MSLVLVAHKTCVLLTCISRPQDIIIFVVGGITFEEARHVSLLNEQLSRGAGIGATTGAGGQPVGGFGAGTRILLGGTCVHNSERYVLQHAILIYVTHHYPVIFSFLDMVQDAAMRFPPSIYTPPPSFANSSSSAPPTALNLQLGSINVSVGGNNPGVTGVPQLEGVSDSVRSVFGKLRDTVDNIRY